MGNAESSTGDCGVSSSTCEGGGGCVIAHDGTGFSIAAGPDGFVVSGGPYADVDPRSSVKDSHAIIQNMRVDHASTIEHTATTSLLASAATASILGDSSFVEQRAIAGHFHSHTHAPTKVSNIEIGGSDNPFYGGDCYP